MAEFKSIFQKIAKAKKINVFGPLIAFAVAFLFIYQIVSVGKQDPSNVDRFAPYLGDYRFEIIEGKMGQKIGDVITVRVEKGQLAVWSDTKRSSFLLVPTTPDVFQIEGRDLEMEFKRNMMGNATEIVARPNKMGIFFSIQRLKE